jgi:hypothetical protein
MPFDRDDHNSRTPIGLRAFGASVTEMAWQTDCVSKHLDPGHRARYLSGVMVNPPPSYSIVGPQSCAAPTSLRATGTALIALRQQA